MSKRRKKNVRKGGRPVFWTKGRCRAEAKHYRTLSEFRRHSENVYRIARKNGWLKDYTWLERQKCVRWTEESVMEEARKYVNVMDFLNHCYSGYRYALRKGLVKKMDWFIPYTEEIAQFQSELKKKVYNLLITVGVTVTKEWLFIESGKEDLYGKDKCRVMLRWSELVNEKWAAWKKYKYWLYDDMKFTNGRDPDAEGFNIKP